MLRILCVSRRWLLVPALVVAGACAADRVTANLTDTTSTGPAEAIVPSELAPFPTGASRRLIAQVVRGNDTVMVTDVAWVSENPAVATISDGNLLTGIAPGQTDVVATRRGRSARLRSVVTGPLVASIRLEPASVSVLPGGSATIGATPLDADGQVVTGRTVVWTSSDASVASVAGGVVSAQRTGSASIVASVDGVVATSAVTVQSAPVARVDVTLNAPALRVTEEMFAVATVRDAAGNVLTGRTVTWSVSDPALVVIDPAQGRLRAVAPGTVSIVATSEGRTGSAPLTITPPRVASIALQPNVLNLTVGGTQTVTATLRDAAGAALANRQPNWESRAPAIASVDANGVVRALAAGTTEIVVHLDGVFTSAAVTVAPVGEPSVSVTPGSATVFVNDAVSLTATLRDPSGNTLPATFTWRSNDESRARVSANGTVQGVAPGTTSIVATADGRSASATITVVQRPVASVVLTPGSLTLVVGQAGSLTAACRDDQGNTLTGRTVTWSINFTNVATVDAFGVVRAVSGGNAMATATCEGRTASVPVNVTAVPVATVTVTPGSATVPLGTTAQLTATTRDVNNNVLNRPVTWTTSNPASVTVTGGIVTAVAVGQATITATSEGRTGTATITVPQPPVASTPEPVFSASGDQLIFEDQFDGYATIDERYAELQRLRRTEGFGTHRMFVNDNRQQDVPNATFHQMHQITSPGYGGQGRALRSTYLVNPANQSSTWSTWPLTRRYALDSTTTAVTYQMRVATPGWRVQWPGIKFFEMWHPTGTTRTQVSVIGPAGGERFVTNPESRGAYGYQPAGTTTWAQVADGQWHRFTFLYKPADSFGDTRGILRMWIDGRKVVDLSAQGAAEGFCTLAEVRQLGTQGVSYLKWPDVMNANETAIGILDFDNLQWWLER